MSKLFVIVGILISFSSRASDIITVRDLLEKAWWSDDKYFEAFSRSVKNIRNEKDPVLDGYHAMEYFMKSKYSMNPYTKLKFFNEGKRMLEMAISRERKNIELRFLRYSVQLNALFFLGYSANIREDRELLLLGNAINVRDLRARINAFLVTYDKCKFKN